MELTKHAEQNAETSDEQEDSFASARENNSDDEERETPVTPQQEPSHNLRKRKDLNKPRRFRD